LRRLQIGTPFAEYDRDLALVVQAIAPFGIDELTVGTDDLASELPKSPETGVADLLVGIALIRSGVISQNLSGRCQLSGRIAPGPIPALLTRMSMRPNRARVVDGDPEHPTEKTDYWTLRACCRASVGRLVLLARARRKRLQRISIAIDARDPHVCRQQAPHHGPADAATCAGYDGDSLVFCHFPVLRLT
jgi:hypothetical protein